MSVDSDAAIQCFTPKRLEPERTSERGVVFIMSTIVNSEYAPPEGVYFLLFRMQLISTSSAS